jgi:hypothetical protein
MKLQINRFRLFTLILFLLSINLFAQETHRKVQPPSVKDFAGTLSFLSSNWMEGREAGAKGGFMAADYIASMMQRYGLAPYGDPDHGNQGNTKKNDGLPFMQQRYFQDFVALRYKTEKATLALVRRTSDSEHEIQLSPGIDYELKPIPNGFNAEAPLVFAGYGISVPGEGYDDYRGLSVKDRIVVVLDGFPGHADTTSPAWKKLGELSGRGLASVEQKLQTAVKHGAMALVVVSANGHFKPYNRSPHNLDVVQSADNPAKTIESDYEDAEYILPGDTTILKAPVIILGAEATNQIFSGTKLTLADFEKRVAADLSPASMEIKEHRLKILVEVSSEPVLVRNVLGIIRGLDSSKSIVVGAHYDHLGMRNGLIYNGADDNASGTSGMLALAGMWSGNVEKPACNIIFAAWTAEEKGLLGSSYFVRHTRVKPEWVKLAINMDMISRSAPEDTAHRILSIGTQTGDEYLRKLAGESNLKLPHPFQLDLWDVTGHTGSDYGSFIGVKIPVMTFFSGFHDDYHTPRDVSAKVDFEKMRDILELVNGCIQEFAGK